jgi:hypothetical protein
MRGGLAALEPRDGPQAPLKPTQATPLDGRFACLSGRDGGDTVRFALFIYLYDYHDYNNHPYNP